LRAEFGSVVFLIPALALTIISFVVLVAGLTLDGYFAAPIPNVLASVDGIDVSTLVAFGLVEIILVSFAAINGRWFRLILLSIGVVDGFFSLMQLRQMQFLKTVTDMSYISVSFVIFVSDGMQVIHWFTPIGEVVRFVVPLAAMALSFTLHGRVHEKGGSELLTCWMLLRCMMTIRRPILIRWVLTLTQKHVCSFRLDFHTTSAQFSTALSCGLWRSGSTASPFGISLRRFWQWFHQIMIFLYRHYHICTIYAVSLSSGSSSWFGSLNLRHGGQGPCAGEGACLCTAADESGSVCDQAILDADCVRWSDIW
jgi:hypothetical protein